jgi:hypothetical protein
MTGKKFLLVLLVLIACFGFVSCPDTSNSGRTYYIALYQISSSTYSGINSNWAPVDALNYANSQSGTVLDFSYPGCSITEFETLLRNLNFKESDINILSNNLSQRGSLSQPYPTAAGGYAFLYAHKE